MSKGGDPDIFKA